MVLATRRTASMKVRLIATLIAVFAFVMQPYVGMMFENTAHAAPVTSHVVINEISPSPSNGKAEWIELYNPTASAVTDLSGWTLSDASNHATALIGSIGAAGFATFTVTDFNNNGDTAYLRNGATTIDTVQYGKIAADHTWARKYDASSDFEDRATGSYNATNGSAPVVPVVVNPVEDTTNGKTFATIQAALSDSATQDNDTITLNADVTTTSFIKITRPIVLNGNGHTITASNTVTSSVIDIWNTTGVSISNLTVNGNGVYIRGVNAYDATVNLNDVTVKNNGKDGVVVNASHVTVNNITTSGNAWDGIDVDKAGAVLTVNGTSNHTETGNAIYLDDTTTGAKVVNTNNQYFISHPNKENNNPNDRAYNLDRSNLVVNATSPTNNAVVRTSNHKLVVTGTFTATQNGANYLQTQLVYNGNSKGIVTTYGAVTNGTLAEFDTTGLPDGGGYYIALTGTDTLGNVSERKIINFTIDNTPPVAAFTSSTSNPTPNGYYNSDFQVGYSATDNVQLKGMNISLRDANDTTGNQWRANCYDNQVETTKSDIGTCTVKLPANLPDGEYFMQIGVQDAAGNWAAVATRNIRIQREVPVQPTHLQVKYQYDSNYIANGSTLWQNAKGSNNLALTWSDKSGDWVDGHDVKVTYPDGTKDSFHQGPNTNSWLIYNNFGKKGNGQYVYSVVADNPNGTSVPSDTFTLYYDTQSPTASFTSTLPHYVNGNFTVTGVADDNVRLSSAFFDVRDSKGYVAGCEAGTFTINYNSDHTHADLSCVINASQLVNGQTYTVRIHDGDMTGHYGGGEDRQIVFDTDAPVQPQGLQAKFQYDGTNVANNAYLNITAKPNGNNLELLWDQPTDWVTGYHILATYPNDNTVHVGYQGPNANAWLIYNGFGQYGNGAYTYQVEAVNPNGSTVSSEKFTLNYDTINPVVEPITVTDAKGQTKDANGANLRGAVTFNVRQTEANPNRLYVEYDQKDSNGKWQKLANTGWVYDKNTADLSVNTTQWADGEYQVKVSTDDKAWNHSGAAATFTVDNTPPTLTVNASNGTNVSGTTSNATDTVTVDGEAATVENVANQNGTYNWSFTPTRAYKTGATTITIVSTDAAGNATQETAQVIVAPAAQQDAVKTNAPSGATTLVDATTSGIQSFAVTPNNDNSTIAPTDGSDPAVLGAQTKKDTKNPTSNAAVLGTNSVKAGTWTIFGLTWYWWLLILAILAGIIAWIVAAARRASDSSL